jgi:hypothetical protein
MRTILILSGATLFASMICFGANDGKVVPKRAEKAVPQSLSKADRNATESPNAKQSEKLGAQPNTKLNETIPVAEPASETQSAQEEAVRLTGKSFVTAYNEENAKAVASHFTTDAEYVVCSGLRRVPRLQPAPYVRSVAITRYLVTLGTCLEPQIWGAQFALDLRDSSRTLRSRARPASAVRLSPEFDLLCLGL